LNKEADKTILHSPLKLFMQNSQVRNGVGGHKQATFEYGMI